MSIQTDLTRIKNAKAAIKTAIEGKGVTVPDATLLDGMAPLIESIQAGGGGFDFSAINDVSKVVSGSFTPLEDTYRYTFEHNLGGLKFFLAINESYCKATKSFAAAALIKNPNADSYFYTVARFYNNLGGNFNIGKPRTSVTNMFNFYQMYNDSILIGTNSSGSTYFSFLAGETIRWVAGV